MTSALPTRKTVPKATAASVFRPDIQGLRAVAVAAVVSIHLFSYPSGGILGVDIFFVISGFLITSHLLREGETRGHISIVDFYKRRIRRIAPVASLVVVTTVVATVLTYRDHRVAVALDGVAALFFVSNWRFAVTDLDVAQPTSPLHHYWSLAVEEQFYILWPLVVIGVLIVAARRFSWNPGRARLALGLIIGLISCASFAFSMWETSVNPGLAFLSTFSRAWELGAGSLLAVASGTLSRLSPLARALSSWGGLALLVFCVFGISASWPTPGPWALPAVAATALVISGGIGGVRIWPLANPVARYVGDISYSLYVWHFPVIVLLLYVAKNERWVIGLIALPVSVALAACSYHWFENPIRRSAWLRPGGSTGAQREPKGEATETSLRRP